MCEFYSQRSSYHYCYYDQESLLWRLCLLCLLLWYILNIRVWLILPTFTFASRRLWRTRERQTDRQTRERERSARTILAQHAQSDPAPFPYITYPRPVTRRYVHTHAHTHARTHACTHICTHIHTHTHTYTHIHAHMRASNSSSLL